MSQQKTKHIVLISLDTLRGDCVGELSQKGHFLPIDVRPNVDFSVNYLDGLAKKGRHYTRCFTAAPYTTAAHASIFTGLFPLSHGLYEYYNSHIRTDTIFEIAKRTGRRTTFKTDFPVILGKPLGFTRGVDRYIVEDDAQCLAELEEYSNVDTLDFIHFGGIHYPYGFHTLAHAGDAYRQKVQSLERELEIDPAVMPVDQFDETFRNDEDKQLLYRYKHIIEVLYRQGNYSRLTKLYIEGLSYFVETRFKPFMERLLKIYDLQETRIYIFGDHGEEWSTTSEGHYKTLSRGVLNVPLIILGSGVTPEIIDGHVRTVDIGASVLAELDSRSTHDIDGFDLFTAHKATPDHRIAVAQTWLGTGKDVLQKHIDDAQSRGFVEVNIPTLKRGETAIDDANQFLRLYDKHGVKIFEGLIELESGRSISDETSRKRLENWLDQYNRRKTDEAGGVGPDEGIRALLRLQGYNV